MNQPAHKLSDANDHDRTAVCSICGPTKMKVTNSANGSVRRRCQTVVKRHKKNRTSEQNRKQNFRRRHQIELDVDMDQMLIDQSGRCAICEDPMITPHLDHDHKTGAMRALLCTSCNIGLGHFGDDAERLSKAANYLRVHR